MKKLLTLLLATLCFGAAAYPVATPKKIITAFPVGSGPDVLARKIADNLSAQWRHPVIVENRPGGNGTVAMEAYVSEALAPQSIYLAANDNFIAYPILYNTQKYSQSMKLLSSLFKVDLVLIASPDLASWQDLVTVAKSSASFGSWGVGSGGHVAGAELAEYLGVSSVHVPYRDFNQWFIDVNSKQLSYSFSTVASTAKLEKAGKIKYIAFSSSQRDPDYPNVPTLKELIGKTIGSQQWVGFYIHSAAPEEVTRQLHQDIQTAIKSAAMQETFSALNYRSWSASVPEFEKQVRQDRDTFQRAYNKFNITVK